MSEDTATKRKRLHMRSIRRGIKEMDLILMAYAQAKLPSMEEPDLSLYDDLLSENDQDLYQWVSNQVAEPARYRALMDDIRAGAVGLTKPA